MTRDRGSDEERDPAAEGDDYRQHLKERDRLTGAAVRAGLPEARVREPGDHSIRLSDITGPDSLSIGEITRRAREAGHLPEASAAAEPSREPVDGYGPDQPKHVGITLLLHDGMTATGYLPNAYRFRRAEVLEGALRMAREQRGGWIELNPYPSNERAGVWYNLQHVVKATVTGVSL